MPSSSSSSYFHYMSRFIARYRTTTTTTTKTTTISSYINRLILVQFWWWEMNEKAWTNKKLPTVIIIIIIVRYNETYLGPREDSSSIPKKIFQWRIKNLLVFSCFSIACIDSNKRLLVLVHRTEDRGHRLHWPVS